jgi:hypothetical protein
MPRWSNQQKKLRSSFIAALDSDSDNEPDNDSDFYRQSVERGTVPTDILRSIPVLIPTVFVDRCALWRWCDRAPAVSHVSDHLISFLPTLTGRSSLERSAMSGLVYGVGTGGTTKDAEWTRRYTQVCSGGFDGTAAMTGKLKRRTFLGPLLSKKHELRSDHTVASQRNVDEKDRSTTNNNTTRRRPMRVSLTEKKPDRRDHIDQSRRLDGPMGRDGPTCAPKFHPLSAVCLRRAWSVDIVHHHHHTVMTPTTTIIRRHRFAYAIARASPDRYSGGSSGQGRRRV